MKETNKQRRNVLSVQKSLGQINHGWVEIGVTTNARKRAKMHSAPWILMDFFAPNAKKPRHLY